MDTLPPSVADWMRENGFTLGEQQPLPVLAAAGAGALTPDTGLSLSSVFHSVWPDIYSTVGIASVASQDGKSEE
jgi:hypothetical protein